MADDPVIGDSSDNEPGIPRWIVVLGIIALVVIILFVIIHFSFGGPMGHGMLQP